MSIYNSTSTPVVINFHSEDRASGSNSSFTSSIVNLGINEYDSVCVLQAQIPRSFYNVPNGQNTFRVYQNNILSICTITPGTYSKYTLRTELSTKLNAIADAGRSYTVVYSTSPDTYKYKFTFAGGVNNVIFEFLNFHMNKQLGFENNIQYDFDDNELVSDNCINLSLFNKCFIKSNLIQNSNDDILLELINYGSTPMLSYCYFQQSILDVNIKNFNTTSLNSWTFTLTDINNNIIDLNGIPWTISVVFFQRSNTHELLKNELLMNNEERLFKIQTEKEKLIDNIKDDKDDKDNNKDNINISNDNLNNDNNDKNKMKYPIKAWPSIIIEDVL